MLLFEIMAIVKMGKQKKFKNILKLLLITKIK